MTSHPELSFATMDEEGSAMKSKTLALYNTPRAKRFSERVADAISPTPKHVDEAMDSSSLDEEYEAPKHVVRKRRSLIKYSDTAQRQRRKLRHQKPPPQSDDEYVDEQEEVNEDEVYRGKKQASRQSSVGSDDVQPKTKNGRRRRLRLQSTNNVPTDTPDIDEDASPTFFPNKTRSINPSVAPIVVGTTTGVNNARRRVRPDHITKKLDRLRHYPHENMLDLSKHLIIPVITPSSSQHRQDNDSSDGGESPIHIPDRDDESPIDVSEDVVMEPSEAQESASPPPVPHTFDNEDVPDPPESPPANNAIDDDTHMDSYIGSESPIYFAVAPATIQETTMESPFRGMSIQSPIRDVIASPTTPVTPHPMAMPQAEELVEPVELAEAVEQVEAIKRVAKDEHEEQAMQRSYFGRVVGSMSRFFWGS